LPVGKVDKESRHARDDNIDNRIPQMPREVCYAVPMLSTLL